MNRKAQLEAAYRAVVDEINAVSKAAARTPPQLVAVSKYKPVEDIEVLYGLGHRHFGENYVQELTEKASKLPKDIHWHFIGALQSGKVRIAREIPNLAVVETLDSVQKASKLNNQRQQIDAPPLSVYIQVNTSNEPQKAGLLASNAADIVALAKHIKDNCQSLRLLGLMTIGSFEQSHDSGDNAEFTTLSQVREEVQQQTGIELGLSMGMSADFVQAIKQGSTNVRVGSNIFGGRMTKDEVAANK